MENTKPEVVCFGEVLWDILPTGPVAGGAPMNVAYHLHQQKKQPALITKIGDDAEGKALLELFQRKDISTEYFATDAKYETGKVYAKQDTKGDMSYDIVNPVAWDFIDWQDRFNELLAGAEYFVYGSLASRNYHSRSTLFKLLEIAPKKVLDINLRAPYYEKNNLLKLIDKADLLKMNLEELELVAGWFSRHRTTEDKMKAIIEKSGLSVFVVTKAGDGATLYMNEQFYSHPGFKVKVADTVGSGDAFLAGILASMMDKASPEKALDYASRLGSFIATQNGGMPDYELKDIWGDMGMG
jgi:fructokinase